MGYMWEGAIWDICVRAQYGIWWGYMGYDVECNM